MKVKFTARGAGRVRIVNGWWQKHRPEAPLLFQEELKEAKRKLLENPHVGRPYKRIEGRLFRQVLLERSQQWAYYRVLEDEEVIVIHSIWGSQRGKEPKLD